MNRFGLLVIALLGYTAGVTTPRTEATTGDKKAPEVLTVRGLNVVDDKGKTVIALASYDGAHGIWVQGYKKETTAGIVAQPEFDTPYLMVHDFGQESGKKGCQFSVISQDGEPVFQFTGKKDVKIVNPLTDLLVKRESIKSAKPPTK